MFQYECGVETHVRRHAFAKFRPGPFYLRTYYALLLLPFYRLPQMSSVVDPVDRAMTYKGDVISGLPGKLGFIGMNRGGHGISPRHVHEVAAECFNGVKLWRYKIVSAVKVPEKELKAWRKLNREKCEGDKLMPKFAEDMTLACISKTHFTHAIKLAADGGRTLYNLQDGAAIKFKNSDDVFTDGLAIQVFGEKLWYDTEALAALMSEDNKDSEVCMREDEIQIQGVIAEVYKAYPKDAEVSFENMLRQIKKRGMSGRKDEKLLPLIKWTMSIPQSIGDHFLSRLRSTTNPIASLLIFCLR